MATDDDQALEQWVDDRMTTLEPAPGQRPDVDEGFQRLEARRARRGPSLGTWMVGGAVVVWIGVMLITVGPFAPDATPPGGSLADGSATPFAAPVAGGDTAREAATGAPTSMTLIAPAERAPAPAFNLPDMDGGEATLDDYAARVLLLNFWATWCKPCEAEMPWFVAFEDVFADEGFAVLGVSVDAPGWEVVRPFLEERPVNYRIALADTPERAAPFGQMMVLPETWLIDRQGRIAAEHIGLVDRAGIEAAIRQLLAE